jgi:hypothetical protein
LLNLKSPSWGQDTMIIQVKSLPRQAKNKEK